MMGYTGRERFGGGVSQAGDSVDDLLADALAGGVEHVAADSEDLRGAGEVDTDRVGGPDLTVHGASPAVVDVEMVGGIGSGGQLRDDTVQKGRLGALPGENVV